jgi:hypothetical protein
VDVPTLKLSKLTTFDEGEGAPSAINPFQHFEVLGFTKDGKFAVVKAEPYLPSTSILTVNIDSGEVKALADVGDASAVAWVAGP